MNKHSLSFSCYTRTNSWCPPPAFQSPRRLTKCRLPSLVNSSGMALCNTRLGLQNLAEDWFSFLHQRSLFFATEAIPSHRNSQTGEKKSFLILLQHNPETYGPDIYHQAEGAQHGGSAMETAGKERCPSGRRERGRERK